MLVVISLVAFVISVSSPGDPAERLLSGDPNEAGEAKSSNVNRVSEKFKLRHRLGLDLPVFYFSISALSDIDTIYRLDDPLQQEAVQRLARLSGQPELALDWFHQLKTTQKLLDNLQIDSAMLRDPRYSENIARSKRLFDAVSKSTEPEFYTSRKDSINTLLSIIPGLKEVRSSWEKTLAYR